MKNERIGRGGELKCISRKRRELVFPSDSCIAHTIIS